MSDTSKPVAWYRRSKTGDATYGLGWFDSYASGGDEPLYTADALAAVREEGRRAGLEEAAKACESNPFAPPICADAIRALKEKP